MSHSFFELSNTNIMVEFRIIGHEFDPKIITKEMSIQPTDYWVEGEEIRDRGIFRTYSCWCLSAGYEETLDINEPLNKIIKQLILKKHILLKLKQKYNVHYRFDSVINIENGKKPAIFLSADTIEFASSIKAEFDFDLYIYS